MVHSHSSNGRGSSFASFYSFSTYVVGKTLIRSSSPLSLNMQTIWPLMPSNKSFWIRAPEVNSCVKVNSTMFSAISMAGNKFVQDAVRKLHAEAVCGRK